MRIIIVGAGKVGQTLCRDLVQEGNDIVLIEKEEALMHEQMMVHDITGVVGNGADYDVLMEADTAHCDVFIAATALDEVNIIACVMAKKMGAAHTIARVRNPEYDGHSAFMREGLGLDLVLNPEKETALQIADALRFPSSDSIERFAHGHVYIVGMHLKADNSMVGHRLKELSRVLTDKIVVCMVERDHEVHIPDGDFRLQADDVMHVVGSAKDLEAFFIGTGRRKRKVQAVLVIGAGRLTHYLLRVLDEDRLQIKVIEKDRAQAQALAEHFPQVTVIWADGTDQEVLHAEGIARFDAVVPLTGIDEENILIAMYAERLGVPKTITKVNRVMLLEILGPHALQTVVTPKQLVADGMVRYARSLSDAAHSEVEALYRLADNRVELLQFLISEDDRIVGQTLQALPLRPGILIACIIRQQAFIFPGGGDDLRGGDRVIIVSRHSGLHHIDETMEAER